MRTESNAPRRHWKHKLAELNRRRMGLLWVIVHHGINEAHRLTEAGIPKEQWASHIKSVTPKLLFDQADNSGLLNDFLRQQKMTEITGAPQLYRSAEALRQAGLIGDEFTPTDNGVSFVKGYLDMLGRPAQWPYSIPVEGGKPVLNMASFVPPEERGDHQGDERGSEPGSRRGGRWRRGMHRPGEFPQPVESDQAGEPDGRRRRHHGGSSGGQFRA